MGKDQFSVWDLARHGKLSLIEAFKLPAFGEVKGKGALWGLVFVDACVMNSGDPWAMQGFKHWVIRWVIPFETPIPCVGAPDLWPVSEWHIAQVAKALNVVLT